MNLMILVINCYVLMSSSSLPPCLFIRALARMRTHVQFVAVGLHPTVSHSNRETASILHLGKRTFYFNSRLLKTEL
jgi:hypothetical protein